MMPAVKLYDPYRIIDPTKPMPAPILSRSIGGKFNGYSRLAAMDDDHFPIDGTYWKRYAQGAWRKLDRLMGSSVMGVPDRILPNEVIDSFSWRSICEIVEAACEQAEKTPTDEKAVVSAAHKFLANKQYEIARAHLDTLFGADAPKELDAVTMSQTLSDWLHENWDLIPEVEF